MKRQTHHYSLWRRISACLAVIYGALLLLMLINNAYATETMRERIYDQLYAMLSQEKRQITSELNDVSTYLASYSLKAPNFFIVERYEQDLEYYSALYKLKAELRNTLTSMSIMQGLFVFPTTSRQLVVAAKDAEGETAAVLVREWIRTECDKETLQGYVPRKWFALELDDHYYLLRILKIGKSYVGAWTDFTNILSRIGTSQALEWIPLFAASGQEIYDMASHKTGFALDLNHTDDGLQLVSLDQSYLAVSTRTGPSWEGALYILVPTRQISAQLKSNYILTMLTAGFFILLALTTIIILRRYLRRPIMHLRDSLIALRNGDFSTRIPNEDTCSEFVDVNGAFNQMVERIEDLKISVYEEQLRQQQTQLLALKNQIAPHFLINCLNAIYHMTSAGDNESIRHMTVCLGDHLRYALADTPVVTLGEELKKVENYVALSRLRFPDCIDIALDVDEILLNVQVPPMILLFQVENIIKYEVVNGEVTHIHIRCHPTRSSGSARLHICIWDTGRGYAPDVLAQLRSPQMLSQSGGHNIGTKNIYQRLHLMYREDFSMEFSNRPDAGAQVDIEIPVAQQITGGKMIDNETQRYKDSQTSNKTEVNL